jgi:hypothetical protein
LASREWLSQRSVRSWLRAKAPVRPAPARKDEMRVERRDINKE